MGSVGSFKRASLLKPYPLRLDFLFIFALMVDKSMVALNSVSSSQLEIALKFINFGDAIAPSLITPICQTS